MKKYTRKQIVESIKYWQKQLKMMNESNEMNNIKITDLDTLWAKIKDIIKNEPHWKDIPLECRFLSNKVNIGGQTAVGDIKLNGKTLILQDKRTSQDDELTLGSFLEKCVAQKIRARDINKLTSPSGDIYVAFNFQDNQPIPVLQLLFEDPTFRMSIEDAFFSESNN